MKNLSIKKKIILWFALILILIVFISEGITISITNQVLNKDARERLVAQVKQNSEEIEYKDTLKGQEMEEGDQFIEYDAGWLEIDDDFALYDEGISTALLDSNGNLLYGRSLIGFPNNLTFSFTKPELLKINGEKYYVFEMPLNNPEGLWLRGYISHNEEINVLQNVVKTSIWLLPLLALLALFGGYLITRRSFKPIAEIAKSAEEIGLSGDLSKRLDIGYGNDEIHQLANTFNGMFDKLERNFEAEKQFTSDVSHELRTPIAVVMAQSEYGLEIAESEEEYKESFEVINRQSRLMSEMVNQLLFFSRIELGTQKIKLEIADISELVEQITAEQSMLMTNGITIESEIEAGVKKEIDISLFTRMLNNLINNSYKYGKPNGHIRVKLTSLKVLAENISQAEKNAANSVKETASKLNFKESKNFTHVLSIKDDGIGIPEENLDKIWNRFFQVDSSRNRDIDTDSGIGLGLSMVKEIAKILGFNITVESTEGHGTEFKIYM